MFWPSMRMRPSWMSDKRSKSFVSVVFPAPLVPTRPTRWPAGMCSSKSSNTCVHASPSVYQKSMPSKSMAPSRTSSSGAPGLSSTRRGSSRMTVMPLASPNARLKRCSPLLMKLNWFVTV